MLRLSAWSAPLIPMLETWRRLRWSPAWKESVAPLMGVTLGLLLSSIIQCSTLSEPNLCLVAGQYSIWIRPLTFCEQQLAHKYKRKRAIATLSHLKFFSGVQPGSLLISQDIDGMQPLKWLEGRRNEVSYRTAPISDPKPPPEFVQFEGKARASLQAYSTDDRLLYPFDKDHAIVAYPMLWIESLCKELGTSSKIKIPQHFLKMIKDKNCFVPELRTKFSAFDF